MTKIPGLKNVLVALFLMALLVFGISSCENSGFKVMSVKEGIHSFTFEYPEKYTLIRLDLENSPDNRFSQVGLSSDDGGNYGEIYVYIWDAGTEYSSPDIIVDKLVDSGRSALKDFNLTDNTSVMLGDKFARQVIFTADSSSAMNLVADNVSSGDFMLPGPRPATYRITSMVASGFAIEIDMTCDSAISDVAADDYQRVLDTFAILD
jgi:hypothetical protein